MALALPFDLIPNLPERNGLYIWVTWLTPYLAGNAHFYLADDEFRQGNYQQAVKDYDQVLQNFPDGNKAAAAELKKGFALLELGQKDEGVRTLRHVVQRYPRSNEAVQARDRLRKLGVPTAGTTARRAPE